MFDRAGLLVRIHSPFPGDKISIKEKQLGKLREVYVVGKLERDGSLVFPGHKFAKSESTAFEEWLRELKTYGAQGSPTGKALWGLSQEQFEAMFAALAHPGRTGSRRPRFRRGDPDVAASREISVSLVDRGRKDARMRPGMKQRLGKLQLRGFSHGTALAMLLSQYGLGFRPEPDARRLAGARRPSQPRMDRHSGRSVGMSPRERTRPPSPRNSFSKRRSI